MELAIVYLSPHALTPYEGNARKHTQEDIDQIKASILADGFNDPIGIWGESNLIVEGHGRQTAAIQMGMETVPCIRLDHMTDAQRRDYAIRHNRTAELSSWDFGKLEQEMAALKLAGIDLSGLGFGTDALTSGSVDRIDIIEDEPPAAPENPTSKKGDIWQLGRHRLMCGDSTSMADVQRLMDGDMADLVITDPPYNVNYEGGTKKKLTIENDNLSADKFCQFLSDAFAAMDANMKPGCCYYIWHADSEGFPFRRACQNTGWKVRQCLIWVKSQFTLGRQDYQWKHEPCLYGWKPGATHYWAGGRKQRTTFTAIDLYELKDALQSELLKFIEEHWCNSEQTETTVLYEEKPMVNADHPTMKPIRLIARLVNNSSREDEIVLDTFGGSGSTMIACEQLGRSCYMMELDPRYVDVIVNRWENFTGEKAVLIHAG